MTCVKVVSILYLFSGFVLYYALCQNSQTCVGARSPLICGARSICYSCYMANPALALGYSLDITRPICLGRWSKSMEMLSEPPMSREHQDLVLHMGPDADDNRIDGDRNAEDCYGAHGTIGSPSEISLPQRLDTVDKSPRCPELPDVPSLPWKTPSQRPVVVDVPQDEPQNQPLWNTARHGSPNNVPYSVSVEDAAPLSSSLPPASQVYGHPVIPERLPDAAIWQIVMRMRWRCLETPSATVSVVLRRSKAEIVEPSLLIPN